MAADKMDTDEKPKEVVPKEAEKAAPSVKESLQHIVALLDQTVKTKDTRLLAGRLHRQTASIRSQLSPAVLSEFITTYLVGNEASESKSFLLAQLPEVQARSSLACCPDIHPRPSWAS